MKKHLLFLMVALMAPISMMSQGWPADYGGVALQGFFWDSFRPSEYQRNQTMATMYGAGWGENDQWFVPVTTWAELLNQKDNIAPFIDLLWLPQSGATVCPDQSVFTTEWEAWRAGHNGSWVCTHYGDMINNPDCMGFVPVFYLDHGRGQTYEINGVTWSPKSYFGTETELINLISAYKAAGTGAMEDVVANHKGGLSTWSGVDNAVDFVDEIDVVGPTTGRTYSIKWDWDENGKCRDICWDDESGMGSGGTDCGGDAGKGPWARDIDHHSPVTQQKIITYLRYLKDELGYIGFRYDYARGFEPKHFAHYNTTVRPTFSVGEFWGTSDDIKSWIKGVYDEGGFQSAAFDFPLQEQIRQAFNDQTGHNFRALKYDGLIWDYRFKRYAVTFIDNHDTFKDLPTDASNSNYQHRVNYQIVEANCFILAMPGTPCLFYPHFMHPDWHDIIARFIKARRTAGITNESTAWAPEDIGSYSVAWRVTGENGELYLQLGDEAVSQGAPEGFAEVWSNTQGTCRLSITASLLDQVDSNVKQNLVYGYPVINKASGNYNAPIEVNVKPSSEGTVLVYTTDGKMPNAYSQQITDVEGMDFSFDQSTTLKVGVLANGNVNPASVVTRDYVLDGNADDGRIRVYVKYNGGNPPYLYAYDDEGNSLTSDYPGWQLSTENTVVVGGVNWLHATVEASKMNLILSYGSWATQSADINGVTSDIFLDFRDNVAYDLTASYMRALYDPFVSIDLPGGRYDEAISSHLTASNSDAVIVYTTDGTEPSPTNGTQITYQGDVTFSSEGSYTLRAGVLHNGVVINQVARTYTVGADNTVNIYVSADADPYIYAWISETENFGDWPGTLLTEKDHSYNNQMWYHYSQEAQSLNIIINNGHGGQTANIEGLTPGDHYFTYDGYSGYTVVPVEEETTKLPSCVTCLGEDVIYCYFENSVPYADPHAWVYNQTVLYTGISWPGEALVEPVGAAPNGNLIYRWVYTGDLTEMPAKIIFNDNGNYTNQTPDFDFVNGGYYTAERLVGVVKSNVMSLADIVSKGVVGKEYVVADDLTGVWLNSNGEWLWVKDDNGDAVVPSSNNQSLPEPESTLDMNYDQSNWAQLILTEPLGEDFQGSLLLGQTVIGKLTDRNNPTIELRANPIQTTAAPYTPNTYIPANFVEQADYFMVEPKAQEYANVKWAVCREQLDDSTFVMVVPNPDGDINSEYLPGAFRASVKQGYWEDMSTFNPESTIKVGYGYEMTGIVKAVDGGQHLLTAISPDDAQHSPVSDKWELYVISVTEAMAPGLLGDANDDGVVDIADVTVLIDYLLGGDPQPFHEVNADINGNGIDISDLTALIDLLLSF